MTTKAARYADLLDDARCEGNWADVPELVRKVRKHDPARECLTLTAETECAISKVTAAGTQPTDLDVPNRLPKLMAVIEAETRPEERFQTQVCVGWLHWVVGEYTLALERLPKSLNEQYPDIDPANTASEWTSVCALKAAYLRANCLMRDGHRIPALAALQKGLPSLDRVWGGHGIRKQLRYWSELFLTEHCMLTSEALHNSEISLDDPNSISSFRSWAKYWKIMSAPVTGGFGFKGSVPRRRIWNEYYLALSRILENDLPYPTGQAEKMVEDMSARSQLRVELQRAEAAYQALLLGETAFPRADEERAEIETFIKQVMMNWSILCGRGWSEQDLGQGGRDLLSRTVLDTLYSAATRTYHSTAILRSLFNVHLSVAEFDLAFKALDSYLDIVKKGKARVAKTGHPEPSLDDDKTALETMSQGIMILCSYGHQQAAEKARHLGAELEDWLSKLPHSVQENGTPAIAEDKEESEVLSDAPPPQTVALAWQAIGLSHAHWSRMTTEAGSRAEIQSKAIRCLRRSLAPEFGRSKDVRSFFSLGLLLAERRELATAIELVRSALIAVHGFEEDYNLFYGPYWQERSLIPLWHLLALLLSARQDYVMAARACEGALEQFKDPTVLFGKPDSGFRSEHLNDAEAKAAPSRGLIDDMSDEEKVGILDVKMTQIALIELMEGPDIAVNASYELLTLFSRLFGSIDVQQQALKPPTVAEPPKTARTFKGSIFGSRADRSRPPTRQISNATLGEKTVVARPTTSHTTAPSIAPTVQVTAENGDGRERSGSVGTQKTRRSESGRRNSLKKKTRSGSQRRRSSSAGGLSHQATVVGDSDSTDHDFFSASGRRLQSRVANSSRGRTLSSLNSYLSTNSKYTDDSELSTDISFTLPHLLPLIKFPKDKEKTQRTAILIKVWLMIAGFYRRAGMLEDCKGAVAEAQKLVHTLESEMARDPASGPGSTRGPAWGEKKSIDELWGDVYSELGLLALAKETPYVARTDFESALTYYPDHPAAIVGLSNILLDIYSEKLLPTPAIPSLDGHEIFDDVRPTKAGPSSTALKSLPFTPLGLVSDLSAAETLSGDADEKETAKAVGSGSDPEDEDELPEPYKAFHLPLVDRLAARDRAFTLLSGLTRLGTGWDYSDAWFALARAHEENGQVEKAREVLWWCVELEEAMGVRDWRSLAAGGYII